MEGIIDTIKLAGALVLAIPAALAGLEFLVVRGETVTGAALLLLAVLFVLVQQRLTMPSDVPELAAKRAVGAVVDEPDTESNDSTDSDGTDSTDTRSPPVDDREDDDSFV